MIHALLYIQFRFYSSEFVRNLWKTTGSRYFLDLGIVNKELGAYISTILMLLRIKWDSTFAELVPCLALGKYSLLILLCY